MVDFFRKLFFIRFAVFFGLLLGGLGPVACLGPARQLLANVFLLHSWWQMASLFFICLVATTLLFVQTAVALFNAQDRFDDLSRPHSLPPRSPATPHVVIRWAWPVWRTALWLTVASAIPATALWYSVTTDAWVGNFPGNVSLDGGLLGLVLGFVAYLLLTLVVALVSGLFIAHDETLPALLPIEITLPDRAPSSSSATPARRRADRFEAWEVQVPGYSRREEDGRTHLNPGHMQLTLFLGVLLLFYVVLYYATRSSAFLSTAWTLPTAFFAVLWLAFVSTVVSGAAFFFDYYRVPTLPLLLLAVGVSYKVSNRDHVFPVHVSGHKEDAPNWVDVAYARQLPRDRQGQRTLVVVTAPGGGIHAAAWTAQVLTGLHRRYGTDYGHSLSLISAVSGGSVGTMYYVANFDRLQRRLSNAEAQGESVESDLEADCQAIVERAGASGLEPLGWGLAFPDLMCLLPFVKSDMDRGTVLDQAWNARLQLDPQTDHTALTLADWRPSITGGHLPVVVFNATDVETGRRILFSPITGGVRETLNEANPNVAPIELTTAKKGKDLDLDVATAARLSATFPYVTPAARPRDDLAIGYVADGGYIDNEGIVTVVDWISRLIAEAERRTSSTRPFDRVLVLRIRHLRPLVAQEIRRQTSGGFEFAVAGPAKAVLTVRETSQQERGQLEADLVTSVKMVFLDYDPPSKVEPPLSWKLTPKEFSTYAEAWKHIEDSPEMEAVDAYFSPR